MQNTIVFRHMEAKKRVPASPRFLDYENNAAVGVGYPVSCASIAPGGEVVEEGGEIGKVHIRVEVVIHDAAS